MRRSALALAFTTLLSLACGGLSDAPAPPSPPVPEPAGPASGATVGPAASSSEPLEDEGDGAAYERTTVRAADGSRTETYRRDGADVARFSWDAEDRRHGDQIWFGTAPRTVRFDHGTLNPSVARPVRPGLQYAWGDALQVLDVDPVAGRVAWRRITRANTDFEPVACRYPGAPDDTAGVTLGLYGIDGDVDTAWVVYEPMGDDGDEDTPELPCTSPEQAAEALAAAKAAWAAAGLDPERGDPPIVPVGESPRWTLRVVGTDVGFEVRQGRNSSAPPITDVDATLFAEGGSWAWTVVAWSGIERPLDTFDHDLSSSSFATPLGAWERDGRGVVAWRLEHRPAWNWILFVRVP